MADTETDWDRIERRRKAFAIIFHREGVSSGDEPMEIAQQTLQVGPSGIASLVLEEYDESGMAARLSDEWKDYERNRLRYLMGLLRRHPKKPGAQRLRAHPQGGKVGSDGRRPKLLAPTDSPSTD